MGSIGLGYIIKNEAVYLEASIRSAAPLADQILVHDTGSTDESLKILAKLQREIPKLSFFSTDWTNDFAFARNQVAKELQTSWVLFLDGDEILDPSALDLIREAIQKNDFDSYSLIQRNYTRSSQFEDLKRLEKLPAFLPWDEPIYYFDNWMERLYRPSTGIRYEGRIHESLLPSCRRLEKKYSKLPAVLHHAGRLKDGHDKKLQYYLQLSEQKWKEENNNPAAWIEYGVTLSELGSKTEAFQIGYEGIKKFPQEPEILKFAFQVALRADQFAIAEKWILEYLNLFPEDLFAWAQLSTAFLYQGKFSDCDKICRRLLQTDSEHFLANLHLGIIAFENKEFSKAKPHLRAALRHKPEDSFLLEALAKISS